MIRNIFDAKDKIKKLADSGIFSIYFSSILSKVIILFGGVIVVRLLNPEDYAIYTLVINALSILTIWGDFGCSKAMLQYAIENKNNKQKKISYLQMGFKLSLVGGGLSALLLLLSRFFYPFKNNTIMNYATILFFIPILLNIINYFNVIMRIKEKNKLYANYQIVTVIIHYVTIILLVYIFRLPGSIYSQYVYNILIIIVGFFMVRKMFTLNRFRGNILTKKEKKDYIHLGISSQVNHTINNLLCTLDIFVVGLLVTDSAILSYYKVATVIPNALIALPQCLVLYLMPIFIKHNNEKEWIIKNTKKLLLGSLLGYGIFSVFLILLSKPIFLILYGNNYLDSVPIFIILVFSFWINASIKMNTSEVLYTLHKMDWNLLISISGLILNLILNFVFVHFFGCIGAAYATLLVTCIISLINYAYYKFVIKNFKVVRFENEI